MNNKTSQIKEVEVLGKLYQPPKDFFKGVDIRVSKDFFASEYTYVGVDFACDHKPKKVIISVNLKFWVCEKCKADLGNIV